MGFVTPITYSRLCNSGASWEVTRVCVVGDNVERCSGWNRPLPVWHYSPFVCCITVAACVLSSTALSMCAARLITRCQLMTWASRPNSYTTGKQQDAFSLSWSHRSQNMNNTAIFLYVCVCANFGLAAETRYKQFWLINEFWQRRMCFLISFELLGILQLRTS